MTTREIIRVVAKRMVAKVVTTQAVAKQRGKVVTTQAAGQGGNHAWQANGGQSRSQGGSHASGSLAAGNPVGNPGIGAGA